MELSWTEIKARLLTEIPSEWCVLLSLAESKLKENGFISLEDFITTSINKGGLGQSLDDAIYFLDFNSNYKYLARELKIKLGLATDSEIAKTIKPLNPQGVKDDRLFHRGETLKPKGKFQLRIARLKRDYPNIAKRLMTGKIKSLRSAEQEAGIKPLREVQLKSILKQFDKLTEPEKKEILYLLNNK